MLETVRYTARTMWGFILCCGLALASAYLVSDRAKVFLPFAFVLVIVAIAARYGVMVGILGSIGSAIIFAHLLYSPLHSFQVDDATARTGLAWMVLCGIAIPYLVLPGVHHRSNDKK